MPAILCWMGRQDHGPGNNFVRCHTASIAKRTFPHMSLLLRRSRWIISPNLHSPGTTLLVSAAKCEFLSLKRLSRCYIQPGYVFFRIPWNYPINMWYVF